MAFRSFNVGSARQGSVLSSHPTTNVRSRSDSSRISGTFRRYRGERRLPVRVQSDRADTRGAHGIETPLASPSCVPAPTLKSPACPPGDGIASSSTPWQKSSLLSPRTYVRLMDSSLPIVRRIRSRGTAPKTWLRRPHCFPNVRPRHLQTLRPWMACPRAPTSPDCTPAFPPYPMSRPPAARVNVPPPSIFTSNWLSLGSTAQACSLEFVPYLMVAESSPNSIAPPGPP